MQISPRAARFWQTLPSSSFFSQVFITRQSEICRVTSLLRHLCVCFSSARGNIVMLACFTWAILSHSTIPRLRKIKQCDSTEYVYFRVIAGKGLAISYKKILLKAKEKMEDVKKCDCINYSRSHQFHIEF